MIVSRNEAKLAPSNAVLVVLSEVRDRALLENFHGAVIYGADPASRTNFTGKVVMLCGDLALAAGLNFSMAERVLTIAGLTENDRSQFPSIAPGQVPLRVHGLGLLYRRFFQAHQAHFQGIQREHSFQALTESNKPSKAHRSGIYLSPVKSKGTEHHFHLLRCSTNLSGPTENFTATDKHIVNTLNLSANKAFMGHASLNHVLAQVYHNHPARDGAKQIKATIKSHADKTKDMPMNGIMAFCTFYDDMGHLHAMPDDPFDRGYKASSALTRLHFVLKDGVCDRPELPKTFSVTLYPGSVFFMPLSTNRLYTHAIRPSELDASLLPTRLGYVVRCSNTLAMHRAGQTWIKRDGPWVPMEPVTPEGEKALRTLYAEENKSSHEMDYGNKFLFSMNAGDYLPPLYRPDDEFSVYNIKGEACGYDALRASASFDDISKGRQGAVLVLPDEKRGIPVVRTTTSYDTPAQYFRDLHRKLACAIQQQIGSPLAFNNALIEHYNNDYFKMGFHSDQALDLETDSYIAVFSCYQYPEHKMAYRKLRVEAKDGHTPPFEITLEHQRVLVFATGTNQRFRHKIVLDKSRSIPDNAWLGITFRCSKTFLQYGDNTASFEDGTALMLANEAQRRAFLRCRRQENDAPDYRYPPMPFTLSKSDLMEPVSTNVAVSGNCKPI